MYGPLEAVARHRQAAAHPITSVVEGGDALGQCQRIDGGDAGALAGEDGTGADVPVCAVSRQGEADDPATIIPGPDEEHQQPPGHRHHRRRADLLTHPRELHGRAEHGQSVEAPFPGRIDGDRPPDV